MERLKWVGSVVLALGVVILAILVGLGFYAKSALHDGILSRLEYKFPEGAKKSPDTFEQCYRDTVATFDDEYYLWNLTNPDVLLAGGKPVFEVVGPFAYTQWYCRYGHSLDEQTGYLSYRTAIEGFMFQRDYSKYPDNVKITNINPAYLGLLRNLGGDDKNLQYAFGGPTLKSVIQEFQKPSTLALLWVMSVPKVLAEVNNQITLSVTSQVVAGAIDSFGSAPAFFLQAAQFNGVEGWTNHTLRVNSSADVNIASGTQAQIFTAWRSQTTLAQFTQNSASQLMTNYSVTAEQATALLDYISYLKALPPLVQQTTKIIYDQWAYGNKSSFYSGWEIGKPTPTDLSFNDVATLFDPTGTCSLVNSASFNKWQKVMNGTSLASVCATNFDAAGFANQAKIVAWLNNFIANVVKPNLFVENGLTSWDDFAYAQWGHLAAGVSLGEAAGLSYSPEVSALSSFPDPVVCPGPVSFTTEEAKNLLNGTHGLFNATNLAQLLTYLSAFDIITIQTIWPELPYPKSGCFFQYLNGTLVDKVILPQINALFAAGGGLVTTRTAREWLFTGVDPILLAATNSVALASVGLVGNLTRTKAEADQLNATYVRVFTGGKDLDKLHWSLMPFNEGTNLTFWNGTMLITGYNGTQFLPYGYVDLPEDKLTYPLDLFNNKVNRTIRFQNKGKDTWDGVNVRYLTTSDDSLQSKYVNPANNVYYAEYSGVINKTSNPPYLPVYLTTPNFHSAEDAFKQNVTIVDNIFTDYDPNDPMSRHRLTLFVLVEPLLGSTLWGNLPIQANFKYGPTTLFPKVNPAFAPIYWNAIGDKASSDNLNTIKKIVYGGEKAWKALVGVGFAIGIVMIASGSAALIYYSRHKHGVKMNASQ